MHTNIAKHLDAATALHNCLHPHLVTVVHAVFTVVVVVVLQVSLQAIEVGIAVVLLCMCVCVNDQFK